jgi:hypothetical protein
MKSIYKGRKSCSKEDTLKFFSKPKSKRALELLKMGMKAFEVARTADVRINIVTKIKKLGLTESITLMGLNLTAPSIPVNTLFKKAIPPP